MRDILKFLTATAVLMFGYNAFVLIAAPRVSLAGLPDGERNQIIAERYIYGPTPDAVIVGSSMSRRLGFGDDQRLGSSFYNLALDGAGPTTGLALIAAKADKPHVVIVETNWLRRPLDKDLLSQVTGFPQKPIRTAVVAFWQEYKLFTLIRSAMSGHLNNPQPTDLPVYDAAADADTAGVPASLKITLPRFGNAAPDVMAGIKSSTNTLRQQIAQLRSAGVHVFLVNLPMHPDLEASPAFQATLAALLGEMPGDRFDWIELPNRGTFHTVDSIHLTGPSAIRITSFLRNLVNRATPRS